MTPETYVNFILNTNADFLGYTSDKEFERNLPTFAFGLAEEVFEVLAAASDEQRAKEIGDVVAYYCLLSTAIGYTRDSLAQSLTLTSRQANTTNTVADYLGVAKRFFRGDSSKGKLHEQAYALVLFCLHYGSLLIEPVLQLNYDKLTARLSSTGTFHGSGDR